MNQSMTIFYQNTPCYNILVQHDLHGLYEALAELSMDKRRICIVTDSNVDALYGRAMEQNLKDCGCEQVFRFTFPAGESSKTLAVIENLYTFLIQHEFDRSDLLLALGGGVVGDMAGFAAATYVRGIRFVQVPTTLLSMVDSSIGGKTGVDFNGYKNMIGAFHQPSLVFVGINVLATLDERQRASGMGEIIKHGLIRDKHYYEWLAAHAEEVLALDALALSEMIYCSQQIKKAVVEKDPKEQGERALLNFGHTIGHAIEKACDFKLLHGECVALGIVAAAYVSFRRGFLKESELMQIEEVLAAYQLPVRKADLNPFTVIENCRHDKKKDGSVIKFVLLRQIGEAFITTDVSALELEEAVRYLMEAKE